MVAKRIGQFLISLIPAFLMLALEVVVMFATMFIRTIVAVVSGEVSFDNVAAYVNALSGRSDFLILYILIFQSFAAIAFGLFYVFSINGKHVSNPFKTFSLKSVPALIMLFSGVEIMISCLLLTLYEIIPNIMQGYSDMMSQSGLTDMTVLSTVATIIIAPVAEEFVFRGITMKLACRMTKKFWVANTIQALIFGLAHLNLVQGIYAFALGLILGYVVKKYDSLLASMIGHCVFNFAGTYLVMWVFGDEETTVSVARLVFVAMCAIIFALAGALIVRGDKKTIIGSQKFDKEQTMIYETANSPKVRENCAPPVNPSEQPSTDTKTEEDASADTERNGD